MVHGICINGIKKEIAFIRHEDAQAFPAACCSVKLLCADVFHDMEIRYSRYLRFESLCGSQGARESREPDAGTETVSRRGLIRRTLELRIRSSLIIRGSP